MLLALGCDPGFAAFGIAQVDVCTRRCVAWGVIRTEPSAKKLKVLASDDNTRRIMEIAVALKGYLVPEVIAICAEAQSWPRNAMSCAKIGMGWGVLGTRASDLNIPVLQASPKQVKVAVCGKGTASKAEVQAALTDYPPWPETKDDRQHVADAYAAVIACWKDPVILLAQKMMAQKTVAQRVTEQVDV